MCFFLLLIADAFDLAVDLFRRSHTATRRIDMNNDGFDGVVIAEFLNLLYHRAGVENDAFQFDHANLVPKLARSEALSPPACRER